MRTAILLVASLAAGALACSGPAQPAPIDNEGQASVASVSISPPSVSLQVGKSTQLSATVLDSAGNALADRQVSWSTTDTLVAKVSATGMLAARKVGGAMVRASAGGKSANASVIVAPIPVSSVTIVPTTPSVQVGATVQLSATTRDANGAVLTGRAVTWSSSNTAVAAITTSSGLVSGVSAGTATITATSEGVTAQATVSVSSAPPPPPAPVASVTVSLAAAAVTVGQTTQATAVLKDASGNVLSGRAISWSSSNTAVATVSGTGLVTTLAIGSASIRATSEGVTGSAALSVTALPPVPVASVSVTLGSTSLNPGQQTQATAVLKDAGGNVLTGRTISWTSSNTSIATVNAGGLVTAVAAGSATIRATSESVMGTAALTVVAPPPAPVASVTVSLASSSIVVGQSTQASAVVKDASGNVLTGRTITWASSNTSVATVTASALVTAAAAGSAQITATSEGKSGSATISITAPPQNAIDTIFYDGFESGTFSKWQDGYNSQKHRIVTDAAGAAAGNRYLEATYPQGQDGGWLTTWFMPGYDSAFVRVHVRFESTWTGSTKLLGLYGSRTDNQWSAFGQAGKCPSGTDFFAAMVSTLVGGSGGGLTSPLTFYTYFLGMAREPDGVTCWGRYGNGSERYTPPLQMTTGTWHRLEFWVKLNTVGQSNAIQQLWLDGQLKGEWSGLQFRTSNILRLNSLQLSFSGSDSKTAHLYFDEVLVTTRRPTP